MLCLICRCQMYRCYQSEFRLRKETRDHAEGFLFSSNLYMNYPCLYQQPRSKLKTILDRSSFHRLLSITLD